MGNKAVIWDMDGVIADTGIEHFHSWQRVLSKRGIDFTEEQFRRNFGQRNDRILRDVLPGAGRYVAGNRQCFPARRKRTSTSE